MYDFDILLIVGPTGSGKTELGIKLAKILNGEIISADSRQIYRYLDIGTAKPTQEELSQVKHYQISIVDPDENFDAAKFAYTSDAIIKNLRERHILPIVVGGSGFYIKALIDGLFVAPPVDENLRKQLTRKSKEELYEKLKAIDPASAQRININDKKRVIRALEVYQLTGKTISYLHTHHQKTKKQIYKPLFIGLQWERKRLYERIEKRIDKMLELGLFNEVESILKRYSPKLNSLQTVGYKEIIAYFGGEYNKDEAINLIKRNSRRYAKRQMTWFGKDKRINWIELGDIKTSDLIERIMVLISKKTLYN